MTREVWGDSAPRGGGSPEPSALDLFRARVAAAPDAIAVVGGNRPLDYSGLYDAASRLAHTLVGRGARPGDIVGVAAPPSTDLVVAVLATWLAGAAYVLIPSGRADRVRHVIDDSGVRMVITRDTAVAAAIDVVSPEATGARPAEPRRADPSDIACLAYTSGSTGSPRGVVIEHGALAAHLRAARARYPGLAASALLHSSVHDVVITALLGPLTSGGAVRLPGDGSGERAALVWATPSQLVSSMVPPADLVVVTGERVIGAALAGFREANPEVTVVAEYGLTEVVGGCCVQMIPPAAGPIPLGEPTAGIRLHVLDAELRAVPVGEEGELYVAGDQLARGYLNRPDDTAATFLPDPTGPPGSRMCRTGDVVRRGPDGLLEFLGRRGDEVKIRGHRVDLGKVEATVLAHGAVERCVVVAEEAGLGVRFVGRAEVASLRAHLERRLPAHLVPAWIASVNEIPLTENGRVDYDALSTATGGPTDVPDSAAAEILCGLFAELTGAGSVGLDDDFLVLGGTSFAAAVLVARARAVGVPVDVIDVLRKRTVRALLTSEVS